MSEWITPEAIHSRCGYSTTGGAFGTVGYPWMLIDDHTGKPWVHQSAHNHWIVVDLGQTYLVDRFRIYQGGYQDHSWTNFDVYVSDDPNDWGDPVAEGIGASATGWQYYDLTPKEGRYVYFADIATGDSGNWIMGDELDVQVTEVSAAAQPYGFIM